MSDQLAPPSPSTTMPVQTNMPQSLSEEQVINGFHVFLQTALAQAKAERLLDVDTLSSAEADLMISGARRSLWVHLEDLAELLRMSCGRSCAVSLLWRSAVHYRSPFCADTSEQT